MLIIFAQKNRKSIDKLYYFCLCKLDISHLRMLIRCNVIPLKDVGGSFISD